MKIFKYKYDDLFNPTIEALHNLGGSGTVSEIEEQVASILNLTQEEVNDIHTGNRTKLSYRLAWSRNYLKRYGLLDNSSRGVWALTSEGSRVSSVDKAVVKRKVRELYQKGKETTKQSPEIESVEGLEELGGEEGVLELFRKIPPDKFIALCQRRLGEVEEETESITFSGAHIEIDDELAEISWQEELLDIVQNMAPDKFERLCQRMLRELGFINVEVTGRTGDGGIDGKGVIRVGGVVGFKVVFQCKRYRGSVPASYVRDFRGAMIGRADRGLLITTGVFTKDAIKEAQREGAPPIDLLDGNQFAMKLKELGLGIETHKEERVKINGDWFEKF